MVHLAPDRGPLAPRLTPIGPIVLAGKPHASASAARIAADLASRQNTELHVIVTASQQGSSTPLQTLPQASLELVSPSEITVHAEGGSPLDAIVRVSGSVDAGLVVIGDRHHHLIPRRLFARFATQLLVRTGKAVLVVPEAAQPWPPQQLVVGLSGGRETQTVRLAGALAKLLGVPVTLMRPFSPLAFSTSTPAGKREMAAVLRRAEDRLGEQAQMIKTEVGMSVGFGTVLVDPVRALILESASVPALVVMGLAYGHADRGGSNAWMVKKVIRGTAGPVLVVPTSAPAQRADHDRNT